MRFADVVVLQMRTVVEPKDLGRRLAALLQKDANDIDRQCADVQRTGDRLAQLFRRMVFQKSQDLDKFTAALAARFRFEPTAKDGEAIRKLPRLERLAEIERVRLAFQQRQVMDWLVMDVFRFPVANVLGDNVAVGDDPQSVERTDDANFAMRVLGRNAVVVPIEPDQRQAVRLPINNAPRLEAVSRNREHRLAILFEPIGLRAALAAQLTRRGPAFTASAFG